MGFRVEGFDNWRSGQVDFDVAAAPWDSKIPSAERPDENGHAISGVRENVGRGACERRVLVPPREVPVFGKNSLITRPARSQMKTSFGGRCSTRIPVARTHFTFLKKGDEGVFGASC